VPRRPPGLSLGFGSLTNAASAGNGRNELRGRVRVRSKNENDSRGPRERKPRPHRGSFLVARNRSSIVLVLVLVSAIGCKSEDVGVPKSNKLALMAFQPREPTALNGRQHRLRTVCGCRTQRGCSNLEIYQ
jgi:hypothetical protein